MGFQVLSDLAYDGRIFAISGSLTAGLGVRFEQMPDGGEQKRFTVHGWRIFGHGPMEPLKFREKSAICNHRPIETRVFVPVGNVQSQLPKGFRTEAERAVNVAVHRCWLPGVRLSAIHEKYAPRRRYLPSTAIGVLL